MPIGLAGPLLVNGEHAQGEFYVPMATAEGTLVASLQPRHEAAARGRRRDDDDPRRPHAARAGVRLPERARGARRSASGSSEHFDEIRRRPRRRRARASCSDIEQYSASRILYTRFNYTTGDAAGQNLTGKATAAACAWILDQLRPGIEHFFLESNFATDKKSSQVNMLRTRGKRVVAEATIPDALLERDHALRARELMFRARQVSNLGGFMSGVNNNGAHSANGITAMFIATGQDVANVAESSAALRLRRAARRTATTTTRSRSRR